MLRYVVTGAPGTGKTALVEALSHLGPTVGEPARELSAENGGSLDDVPEVFVARLIQRSVEKFDSSPDAGIVVYDRGLPDCIAYARAFGVDPTAALHAAQERRYANPVFLTPPWEEIYTTDEMRRASFEMVKAFHDEIVAAYQVLGYDLVELPKVAVADRVEILSGYIEAGRP